MLMVPWWASTRRLAVGSPSPDPRALVVKNGVKSSPTSSAESRTLVARTRSGRCRAIEVSDTSNRAASLHGVRSVHQQVHEDNLEELGIPDDARRVPVDLDTSMLLERRIAHSANPPWRVTNVPMSTSATCGCGGRAKSSRSFISSLSASIARHDFLDHQRVLAVRRRRVPMI